jgi:hypothetical protein
VYLIKRLWIDPLENDNAYGFESIGFVSTKEEADRICSLKYISKKTCPWPLEFAFEFKGDSVPMFKAEEVKILNSLTLEELSNVNG